MLMKPLLLQLLLIASAISLAQGQQHPFSDRSEPGSPYYHFPKPIRRVAVIGAGPAGLQYAAALRDHGFHVRLFDRAPGPGGTWLSTATIPIRPLFPNPPVKVAAYVPDMPTSLPHSHVYAEGEGGLTLDERWREHWNPSPVWFNLTSNSAPFITNLPGIEYPPDTPWVLPQRSIRRHVRAYAASVGLSDNDEEARDIVSYSTRVERLQKSPSTSEWVLTLRQLHRSDDGKHLSANWWTENVDAVVIAASNDAASVPEIRGLEFWAKRFPDNLWHARDHRSPTRVAGKNVLIIGGAVTASELSRDIAPYVQNFSVSMRAHEHNGFMRRLALRRFPANITHLPEIIAFDPSHQGPLKEGKMQLLDGTWIKGFDEIILATGYLTSFPFLADYHNETIVGRDDPPVAVPPLITDGTHVRSLFWTGHYIPDPTLAFPIGNSWNVGAYHGLLLARVWGARARLPDIAKMWEEYELPWTGRFVGGVPGAPGEEALTRQMINFLNSEAIEFGGRLVGPLLVRHREAIAYYADQLWEKGFVTSANFTYWDNAPSSQWGKGMAMESIDW